MIDRKVKHLYWRAAFGLPLQLDFVDKDDVQKEVDHLFEQGRQKHKPLMGDDLVLSPRDLRQLNPEMRAEVLLKERMKVTQLSMDWLDAMTDYNGAPLLERMTLFWHGHFACESRLASAASRQINTIRDHALGNFRDLCIGIAKDPSMIRYLNNQQNRKQSPNENFARELMELFTIGIGNYTETDIKEAARAFTGWSSNLRGAYVFRRMNHDYGQKTFMGKSGNFDGVDIIDILLEKRETARFISSKVYAYFVNETINKDHVEELTNVFYRSSYNIKILMEHLFRSDWFYDSQHYGSKIKSPIELLAGIKLQTSLNFIDSRALIYVQRALGQVLFHPPNVAGWNRGKAWIDNSTLLARLHLPRLLFHGKEITRHVKVEAEDDILREKIKTLQVDYSVDHIDNWIQQLTQPIETMAATLIQSAAQMDKRYLKMIKETSDRAENYALTATTTLMSLPEYQMC